MTDPHLRPPPAPLGKQYKNFQIEMIKQAKSRSRILLADEMGCLAAGTLVNLESGSSIPISQIFDIYSLSNNKPKLKIMALCGNTLRCHRVRNVIHKGKRQTIKVSVDNGSTIELTQDHEVLRHDDIWVPAGKLCVGERVQTDHGLSKVVSVTGPQEAVDVYDIVMEDPYRNFVANGFIVHNCGKTIEAIGVINDNSMITRILIVCPASLRLNWKKELMGWLVRRETTIGIATNRHWPKADIVVCSYDALKPLHRNIHSVKWDLVIVDEAHYLKNGSTRRTLELLGRESKDPMKFRPKLESRRWLLMTGTPIVNRPYELWPLIHHLAPEEFDNKTQFINTFCGGKKRGQKIDDIGVKNLNMLHDKLKNTIMIRRTKQEVLPELPPKIRQLILLPDDSARLLLKNEKQGYRKIQDALTVARLKAELAKTTLNEEVYKAAVKELRQIEFISIQQISKLRYETALAKVPLVIEHIRHVLDHVNKVVVFAHHTAVIENIALDFGKAVVIAHGKIPTGERQNAIDRFQNDPTCKVFVGSIDAAGIGVTLTAAQVVLFAELSWTPSALTQCEDRLHRISQRNSVLVQHLVLDGSIDATIAARVVEKQETISAVMDPDLETRESLYSLSRATPFVEEDRDKILRLAEELGQAQVNRVHDTLIDEYRRGQRLYNALDFSIIKILAELDYLEPAQAALGLAILRKYTHDIKK